LISSHFFKSEKASPSELILATKIARSTTLCKNKMFGGFNNNDSLPGGNIPNPNVFSRTGGKIQAKLLSKTAPHRVSSEISLKLRHDSSKQRVRCPSPRLSRNTKPLGNLISQLPNGLELYEPPMLSQPVGRSKTALFLGETGSGKSKMINSIANYYFGVHWDDPFRYQVVRELEQRQESAQSQTKNVKLYHFAPTPAFPWGLTLVDSPGFCDTSGIARDEEITNELKEVFNTKLATLDVVCYVMPASQPRLTDTQQYIYHTITSLFGKDIEHNIVMMFTFADAAKPTSITSIKQTGLPYKYHFRFNNSALYLKEDESDDELDDSFVTCGRERDAGESDEETSADLPSMQETYWKTNSRNLGRWFQALSKKFQTKSLQLSRQVLDTREHMEYTVVHLQRKIDSQLEAADSKRTLVSTVKRNEDAINENQEFEIEQTFTEYRKKELQKNIHTTTCLECRKTCHNGCKIVKDSHKLNCLSMDEEGNCTNCPGRCSWEKHSNLPFVYQPHLVTKKIKLQETYSRFVKAQRTKSKAEQILAAIERELGELEDEIAGDILLVQKYLAMLENIALKPVPFDKTDYLERMIMNQEYAKDVGWKARVRALQALVKKQKTVIKINAKEKPRTVLGL